MEQAGTEARLLTYDTLQSQKAGNVVHDASFKLSDLLLATATACQVCPSLVNITV